MARAALCAGGATAPSIVEAMGVVPAREAAGSATRAKPAFVATVKHEGGTPVSGGRGAAELLAKGERSTCQAAELCDLGPSGLTSARDTMRVVPQRDVH